MRPAVRSAAIDALRGVAILLVLGRHIPEVLQLPAVVHTALAEWRRFGWIGVDLFFVLSGFLVSGLLFREHQRHGRLFAGRFLIRRGFKIYPGFYLLLFATWLVLGRWLPPHALLSEGLFVQNYWLSAWAHT
ncbi:MAG: acyltransferase [Myxococcales bacterium]|nr:acyltransferase [Myxococcales bacterium]